MLVNPLSGRKVSKNGKIGRTLIKDINNHEESGNLKIIKKIDSHSVPNFIQVLKKKISNSLNFAKKIVNQFLINPSKSLWKKATKAIYNVFQMALNFLSKINIFSKKVKNDHIQKGGGIGTFILKAGKKILFFPFRVIYTIIAETIRFIRDIMVNCASTLIMILLVLIVVDEGLAAYRGKDKGIIRKYAWIGVVKATGTDKLKENKNKDIKDIGWVPVAKKIVDNSKESISSIDWNKLYNNIMYIFSFNKKQKGGNLSFGNISKSKVKDNNDDDDDDDFVKKNIEDIRKLHKKIYGLEIDEKSLLKNDSQIILNLKTFGFVLLTIVSAYSFDLIEKRGKIRTFTTKRRGIFGTTTITRKTRVHDSLSEGLASIILLLGTVGAGAGFIYSLKKSLQGSYSKEELEILRNNIKLKEEQIIDKINNLPTPQYLELNKNEFNKYNDKIMNLIDNGNKKFQKFSINYFTWDDFLKIKYSNKYLKAYIVSPLKYKNGIMKFTEINKNNYKNYEKKTGHKNNKVYLIPNEGHYLILDDKFIKFLNKM